MTARPGPRRVVQIASVAVLTALLACSPEEPGLSPDALDLAPVAPPHPDQRVAGEYDERPAFDGQGVLTPHHNTATLLGSGTGSFPDLLIEDPSPYPVGFTPTALALADLNGDGIQDLIVAGIRADDADGFFVRHGNGDGTFRELSSLTPTGTRPFAVVVADLDGDGLPDLAVANLGSHNITTFLGNGSGGFGTGATRSTGSNTGPTAIAVADLNNDGIPDLITANRHSHTLSVLRGTAQGGYTTAVQYPVGATPWSVAAVDLNSDGHPDLVAASLEEGTVSVLLNNGDGTFQDAVHWPAGDGPAAVLAADLNGNGHPDIATANRYSNTVSVLLGQGDGTFQPPVEYPAGGQGPASLTVVDLDGNGHLDLVTTNTFSNTVGVLMGYGDGTFHPGVPYAAGSGPASLAVGLLTADGVPDLVVTNVGYTWTAEESPYQVSGQLLIPPGVTLVIEPGVLVRFQSGASLLVEGGILAEGTEAEPITFTTTAAFPAPGNWNGVTLGTDTREVRFEHCVFRYATRGINRPGGTPISFPVRSSTFRHNRYGMYLVRYNGEISGSTFLDSTTAGIHLEDSASPRIRGNTIQRNHTGIHVRGYGEAEIRDNLIIEHSHYGIEMRGLSSGNPRPTVAWNDIFDNARFNIRVINYHAAHGPFPLCLPLHDNWWGDTNPVNIAGTIYDYAESEDTQEVIVDFIPFLDGPTEVGESHHPPPDIYYACPLTTDTVWEMSGDQPVVVLGAVIVPQGVTLTVRAGTRVEFATSRFLRVDGILQVEGSQGEQVLFTSPEQFPEASDWKGVRIEAGGTAEIQHARFEYAVDGLRLNGSTEAPLQAAVSSSTFRNNRHGAYLDTSHRNPASLITFSTNRFEQNTHGLYLLGASSPLITMNTITENTSTGVYLKGNSSRGNPFPTIQENNIHQNGSTNSPWNIRAETYYGSTLCFLVDAEYNWWGTTDPLTIAAGIYDFSQYDRFTSTTSPVFVDFLPFLSGPFDQYPPPDPIASPNHHFGPVLHTETWDASAGPHYVLGTMLVPHGSHLTIAEGTEVLFAAARGIWALPGGQVSIHGTSAQPVTLGLAPGWPVTAGTWRGIRAYGAHADLQYCRIEGAATAVHFEDYSSGTVRGCTIQNNTTGVYLEFSSPDILRNRIQGNRDGLYIRGGCASSIRENHIQENSRYGIWLEGRNEVNPSPTVTQNDILDNGTNNVRARSFTGLLAVVVPMPENWWGSDDPHLIAEGIHDYSQSRQTPEIWVDFTPWLNGSFDWGGTPVELPNMTFGIVDTNTVWDDTENPYHVVGSVVVRRDMTLTIRPGVSLYFSGNRFLLANGILKAQGTAENPVVFGSGYAVPQPGDWAGIEASGGKLNLRHVTVTGAARGVNATASTVEVADSVFRNNTQGIRLTSADTAPAPSSVQRNLLEENQTGIHLDRSSPCLAGNTVQQNTTGIYAERSSMPCIIANNIENNARHGVQLKGTVLQAANPVPARFEYNNISGNGYTNPSSYFDLHTSDWHQPCQQATKVTAENNYWGSANPGDVAGRIRRCAGIVLNAPIVDFEPLLTAPHIPSTPPRCVPLCIVCETAADCDDGIPCTIDSCTAGNTCVNEPDDALCTDPGECGANPVCDVVEGCLYEPGDHLCDDGIDCTEDVCDETLMICRHTPVHERCSDGLWCTGDEVCDPTLGCLPGAPPCPDDGLWCTGTLTCDEAARLCIHSGNPCDEQCQTCDEAGNRCDPISGPCDDGVFCNGADWCVGGTCSGHSGDPCEEQCQACNEDENRCDPLPEFTPCDDGLFCNGTDWCVAGACSGHSGDPCIQDDNECTVAVCSEQTAACDTRCAARSFRDPCCEDPACEGERPCTSRPTPWLLLLLEDEDPPPGAP